MEVYSKAEADNALRCASALFDTLPKSKRLDLIDVGNQLFLFIEKVARIAAAQEAGVNATTRKKK